MFAGDLESHPGYVKAIYTFTLQYTLPLYFQGLRPQVALRDNEPDYTRLIDPKTYCRPDCKADIPIALDDRKYEYVFQKYVLYRSHGPEAA
jgi:hypothetical protein